MLTLVYFGTLILITRLKDHWYTLLAYIIKIKNDIVFKRDKHKYLINRQNVFY